MRPARSGPGGYGKEELGGQEQGQGPGSPSGEPAEGWGQRHTFGSLVGPGLGEDSQGRDLRDRVQDRGGDLSPEGLYAELAQKSRACKAEAGLDGGRGQSRVGGWAPPGWGSRGHGSGQAPRGGERPRSSDPGAHTHRPQLCPDTPAAAHRAGWPDHASRSSDSGSTWWLGSAVPQAWAPEVLPDPAFTQPPLSQPPPQPRKSTLWPPAAGTHPAPP